MTFIDLWAIMPLLILAAGSLLVLLIGAIIPGRYTNLIGVVAALSAALWAVMAPPAVASVNLGIAFSPFARFFTILFSITAAASLLLSHDYNRRQGIVGEEYPATVLFATFGMAVLSTSLNFLTLFLGLEALTFAFYILVAIDRNRPPSAEAGLKYLLLGAVSAAFIAFGIALIYCGTGTLDLAPAMKASLAGPGKNALALCGLGLLLVGLAFKVSLVPAHLWTPDVYQGAPLPVVAFLATGSKGAAWAFLLLLFSAADSIEPLRTPLWWLSLLSMTIGNLAALLQTSLKRLLAYSAIAQMGYVALALLTASRDGYEAVVFYVVAYTAMNLAAFGALATIAGNTDLDSMDDYKGLGRRNPLAAAILALAMFALAGIPPTAGFTGKFFIFAAALKGGETLLAVIGILTAAVSVYFYLRVVVNLYLQPAEISDNTNQPSWSEMSVLCAAAAGIFLIGLWPAPLLKLISIALH